MGMKSSYAILNLWLRNSRFEKIITGYFHAIINKIVLRTFNTEIMVDYSHRAKNWVFNVFISGDWNIILY